MADACTHLDQIKDVSPSGDGCVECLASGGEWVHLRMCSTCGHIGCCDDSASRHATSHNNATHHPVIRSFEPEEGWYWCYPDDLFFELEDAPPAPVHS
jgi:hypothetical protein